MCYILIFYTKHISTLLFKVLESFGSGGFAREDMEDDSEDRVQVFYMKLQALCFSFRQLYNSFHLSQTVPLHSVSQRSVKERCVLHH